MMGARSRDEALDLAGAQSEAIGSLKRSSLLRKSEGSLPTTRPQKSVGPRQDGDLYLITLLVRDTEAGRCGTQQT